MQSLLRMAYAWIIFLQVIPANVSAQYTFHYNEEPETELAFGVKAVVTPIRYGKNELYVTDNSSIGIQPVIRYDYPVKIFNRDFKPHYINLVGQAGFLFCKANVFDTTIIDPTTNNVTYERSANPTYLPVYFGVYNRSAFSIGAEVFYWKGLGTTDIWGIKFLSLGYNARTFRILIAGERYAQVKHAKNGGTIFAIDFFWKLIMGG